MDNEDLLRRYNYDSFIKPNFEPWMRFDSSPPVGEPGLDFPLWQQEDQNETRLSELWSNHRFLVVEFGSFT